MGIAIKEQVVPINSFTLWVGSSVYFKPTVSKHVVGLDNYVPSAGRSFANLTPTLRSVLSGQ